MSTQLERLIEIVAALRHPETGCPWDLEQTHESLKPYAIEETYEMLEAIDSGDDSELRGELGDVLLQVVLHAQIAKERKAFSLEDVAKSVADKMVRRHPHVFGDVSVDSSKEVKQNWEQIKQTERGNTPKSPRSVLDGVPKAMPAMIRAQRLGEKAAHVSFDWENAEQVWSKVREEIAELEAEFPAGGAAPEVEKRGRVAEELGDVLFALTQFARHQGLVAEDCLQKASNRFTERFKQLEKIADKPLKSLNIAELEALWQQAKRSLASDENP